MDLTGNIDKIRKAVIGGSLAPLLMFLVWNAVILGTVSSDAGLVAAAAGGVFDPLQVRVSGVFDQTSYLISMIFLHDYYNSSIFRQR